MNPFEELTSLLHRRVEIIGDHAWRDRDPAGQLAALAQISQEITVWGETHQSEVDAQLRHFLKNASYQKALSHVETQIAADYGI